MNTKKISILSVVLFLLVNASIGQTARPLTYYLPEISYDPSIPTPESYLGFQIGEWHVSHDQLVGYFKVLDAASDRIEIAEYARSHEHRPLIVAMISSPDNLKNKASIKKRHQDLSNAETASSVNINSLPAVLWQGYTIHGNEPSGNNAALLVAYYLAAGQSKEVTDILNNTFILLDPCLNPDGSQRFSTWVNSHKGQTLITDPASREYNEAWPSGRYNHYWFDMNRDWLLLVHPESRGRVKLFHEWHPNVLTDHHEMGTNSTFFFQPGIPSANNPNTPKENQVLTEEIAKYHAKALDSIGSMYYTKANFDDFYYGKGSTYPDAHGCIGILFEQASSRGHLQESVHGLVSFPFTIRNQVNTSLSTQKAVLGLKSKILSFKQSFHSNALTTIGKETTKSYVFTDADKVKLNKFIDVLLQHQVDVYPLEQSVTIGNKKFEKGQAYIVPLSQSNPIIAKTIFEQVKTFQDSSFYDVSAWTMSFAYGLDCAPSDISAVNIKTKLTQTPDIQGKVHNESTKTYAYIIHPTQQNLHQVVYQIQNSSLICKVLQSDIFLTINDVQKSFPKGSIIIQVQNQSITPDGIATLMKTWANKSTVDIYALTSGNGTNEVTLGHPSVVPLEKPTPIMIVGQGISPAGAGEVWHQMDLNLHMGITQLELSRFRSTSLHRYNTLIMPEGSYNSWGEQEINKLKEWTNQGNCIIAIGNAAEWLSDKKVITLNQRKTDKINTGSGKYENADREMDAKVIGGSIFETEVDLSNPIFYGYTTNKVAFLHSGTKYFDGTSNNYATPARYTNNHLISGYIPKGMESAAKNAAAVTVHSHGQGRIICFQDNPLFRGYWYAGIRAFNNAIFFNKIIDKRTTETGE